MTLKKVLVASLLFSSFFSYSADDKVLNLLKQSLSPGAKIISSKDSPVDGFLEVQIDNQIVYLSKDGEKVLSGDLYDLKNKFSYTNRAKNILRKNLLNAVKDQDKIIFKAKNEKHKVIVFTDITCPFCTEAHKNVPKYNSLGITVEYLAYPRSGIGSTTAKNMQKIWCAEDKTVALGEAKLNKKLPKESCEENQVNEQFLLGRDVGVEATPTFILDNGLVQRGLIGPKELLDLFTRSK